MRTKTRHKGGTGPVLPAPCARLPFGILLHPLLCKLSISVPVYCRSALFLHWTRAIQMHAKCDVCPSTAFAHLRGSKYHPSTMRAAKETLLCNSSTRFDRSYKAGERRWLIWGLDLTWPYWWCTIDRTQLSWVVQLSLVAPFLCAVTAVCWVHSQSHAGS